MEPDIPQLVCPENFESFCESLCLPSCGKPIVGGDFENIYNFVVIILFVINLTGGLITLIVSIKKRETM